MLQSALQGPEANLRWAALRATRSLKDPEIAETVRPLALDGNRYERSLALEAVTNANLPNSTDLYLAALSSPYRGVRLRGLRALAGDRQIVEPFVKTVTDDEDPELRAFAARTLGEREQSPSTTAALLRAFDDRVPLVQEEAVRSLVRLGDPTLTGLLRHRLVDAPPEDRVAVVRLMALVPDPTVLVDLVPLLADPDAEVRTFAATAVLMVTGSREGP